LHDALTGESVVASSSNGKEIYEYLEAEYSEKRESEALHSP
jgi:hypothetical protein